LEWEVFKTLTGITCLTFSPLSETSAQLPGHWRFHEVLHVCFF